MSNQHPASFLARGNVIAGKYKLLRQIGAGAMGVVWAATNEATARDVALKLILRPEPEFRLRLQREARACGALKHRNIIDVYDIGQTDQGDPFLVMQLLVGETVAELLARKRRLEPSEAASIGRDVARALAVAHRMHIIHRDLKPANIFLNKEPDVELPVVKVLDFGVAKNLSASDGLHTVVGGAVGSPLYMSPEQVRAQPDVDHRADIWALGVVLFEMLTGVRPFQGEATEVFARIVAGEIPTVSRYVRRVDPALAEVVARCMARPREQRFQDAAEVAERLERHAQPGAGLLPKRSGSTSDSGLLVMAPQSAGSAGDSSGGSGVAAFGPPSSGGAAPVSPGSPPISGPSPRGAGISGPYAAVGSGPYPAMPEPDDDEAATIPLSSGRGMAAMAQLIEQRAEQAARAQPAMRQPAMPPAMPQREGVGHGTVRMVSSPEMAPWQGGAVPEQGASGGPGWPPRQTLKLEVAGVLGPGVGRGPVMLGSAASSTTPLVTSASGPTVGGGTLPLGTHDLAGEGARRRRGVSVAAVAVAGVLGLAVGGAVLFVMTRGPGEPVPAAPPEVKPPSPEATGELAPPEVVFDADEKVERDAGVEAGVVQPSGGTSAVEQGLINREFPGDPPPVSSPTSRPAQPPANPVPADPCAGKTGILLKNCEREQRRSTYPGGI